MDERRPPEAPLHDARRARRHAPPPDGRPAAPCARACWRDDTERIDVELSGERGLVVVPMPSRAAERASMLLEALDRAAGGGQRKLQISRGSLTLELDLPRGWPEATRLPSMVLGEGSRFAPAADGGSGEAGETRPATGPTERLSESETALLRDYPQRRRGLAARRRHVEAEILAHDDRVVRRDRAASALIALAGLALLVATVGAMTARPRVLIASAAAFFATSVVFALARLRTKAFERERAHLEARLSAVADLERELDDAARALAERLDCRDPWEASDRVRREPPPRQIDPAAAVGGDVLGDWARRLLEAAGEPADAAAPGARRHRVARHAGPRGWPAEVSSGGGPLFGAANILGVAGLLARTDALLDAAWPLVLHDPWPDHDDAERARLLLAIAHVARPRPVLAFVDAPPAEGEP